MNIKLKTQVRYSPEQIWGVLKHTRRIPDWSPNFLSFRGSLREGERFRARVLRSSGQAMVLRGQIVRLIDKRLVTWQSLGWFSLWSKHQHQIKLLPHPEGYTEVVQLSRFKGLILRYLKPEHVVELQRQMHVAQNALIIRLDELYEPNIVNGAAPRIKNGVK